MKPILYEKRILEALTPLNPRLMKERRLIRSLLFSSDFLHAD